MTDGQTDVTVHVRTLLAEAFRAASDADKELRVADTIEELTQDMDSLDALDVLGSIEEALGLQEDVIDLTEVVTVGDLVRAFEVAVRDQRRG